MCVVNIQLLNFQSNQNDNHIPFIFLPNEFTTFVIYKNQLNSYSLIISSPVLVLNVPQDNHKERHTSTESLEFYKKVTARNLLYEHLLEVPIQSATVRGILKRVTLG